METTPFPHRPIDVGVLSPQEFIAGVDLERDPSLDLICSRFLSDTNRALLWLIRFGAFNAWRVQPESTEWLRTALGTERDAREAAASFTLNDRWEFDADDFRVAVSAVIAKRQRNA